MSRIANNPVQIPEGVEVTLGAGTLSIKGGKGNLSIQIHDAVASHEVAIR